MDNRLPIQSYIINISVPKTPEQLFNFMYTRGEYDLDAVFTQNYLEWTSPRWAKIDDVVFFMHAVCAHQHLRRVRKEIIAERDYYAKEEFNDAMSFLEHGLDLHKQYGVICTHDG